jgi:co-chaperonin GroES (HSP10)
MITIIKTDNIFDVITKIREYKTDKKSITIIFPFGHNILYNKVDLQSIKSSSVKKIIIKTNDILSKKI